MNRTAYHREYYRRTAARRRRLASHRRQIKHWTRWLLAELMPRDAFASPTFRTDRIQPIRRPVLRLTKTTRGIYAESI